MPPRQILSAIIYVLRTGCPWKELPREFGSASAVHKHFQKWQQAGFFLDLWRAGLAEDDELEGIAWSWRKTDENVVKPTLGHGTRWYPPGGWMQARSAGRRIWGPAVARRARAKVQERKLP